MQHLPEGFSNAWTDRDKTGRITPPRTEEVCPIHMGGGGWIWLQKDYLNSECTVVFFTWQKKGTCF